MHNNQSIGVIILVGGSDFGRCPLTSHLPTALWPINGTAVLERLLIHLADQGVKHAVICSEVDVSLLKKYISSDPRLELEFIGESLPVGTAGGIRDAARGKDDQILIVFSANIVSPPDINTLLVAHSKGSSDMTVMFNPVLKGDNLQGGPAGIYICHSSVIENIPAFGYFDIKEELIPEMLRVGKSVYSAILPNHVGNFRDRQGYLRAIGNFLSNTTNLESDLKTSEYIELPVVSISDKANVDPSARVFGPVVIMDEAVISKDALICGPSIIQRNVYLEQGAVVLSSVLWDHAQLGAYSQVNQCVVGYNSKVQRNSVNHGKSIASKHVVESGTLVGKAGACVMRVANKIQDVFRPQVIKVKQRIPNWLTSGWTNFSWWIAVGLVFIAFLWAYWTTIVDLWQIWQKNDEYSSGLLVPFLAVYILWSRRHDILKCKIKPSIWGIFALLIAQSIRLFGLFFWYSSAERLSVVLSIASLVLLLFGWQVFRKTFTVLVFLFLMLPWPNRVQAFVVLPLQRWATYSAVFSLEVLGYDVVQEGNIIHIGNSSVAVVEACNGLRMITAFFVISGLVVLLVKRPLWEKLVILASSIPIALFCNTIRLTITAIAFTVLSGEYWERIFHDFGGYAMMPLSLGIIIAELWILTKLTTIPAKQEAIIVTRSKR